MSRQSTGYRHGRTSVYTELPSVDRKRTRVDRLRAAVKLAIAAVAIPTTALGAPSTWVGLTDTQWSTGTNWSLNAEPTAADDLTFPTPVPGTGSVLTLSAGELANSLSFQTGYTLNSGNLSLTAASGVTEPASTPRTSRSKSDEPNDTLPEPPISSWIFFRSIRVSSTAAMRKSRLFLSLRKRFFT